MPVMSLIASVAMIEPITATVVGSTPPASQLGTESGGGGTGNRSR